MFTILRKLSVKWWKWRRIHSSSNSEIDSY